ncbi:MAG: site-2 protease family protein [Patescibacteria group bacterium]
MELIIIYIIIVLMSVVIHEVAHGYAADVQGDPTAKYEGRLTLNPLKHLDPIGSVLVPIVTSIAGFPFGWAKPVPYNPYNLRNQRWGELFVALAGPLSNILIALFFVVFIRLEIGNIVFMSLAQQIIIVNLGLALFNMIPIPPLDGSKVLFAFLPFKWMHIRRQLEQYSMILILILILVPTFGNILGSAILYLTQVLTGLNL